MTPANLLQKLSSEFSVCWNWVHYSIFIWLKFALKISNYVNPIEWILRIPLVRNFYRRHGVDDFSGCVDRHVMNDEEKGINIVWAGSNMGVLIGLTIMSAFNVVQGMSGKPLFQTIWSHEPYALMYIGLIVTAAGVFNYLTLFRGDKYLVYFHKFEVLERNIRIKNHCFSALVIVLIFVFFAFSLSLLPKPEIDGIAPR